VHCPVDRGRLDPGPAALRCLDCSRTYPVRDGIVELPAPGQIAVAVA